MVTSLREAVLAKLVQARAALEKPAQLEAAREWQKGYVRALEAVLDLQGLTLRRYPRWQADTPTNIARMVPKQKASGQIVDLSVGGCRLVAPIELSAGAIIKHSFNHPERSTIVTLHGLVCRTERVSGEHIAGVEFIGLPEDIAEALGGPGSAEDRAPGPNT